MRGLRELILLRGLRAQFRERGEALRALRRAHFDRAIRKHDVSDIARLVPVHFVNIPFGKLVRFGRRAARDRCGGACSPERRGAPSALHDPFQGRFAPPPVAGRRARKALAFWAASAERARQDEAAGTEVPASPPKGQRRTRSLWTLPTRGADRPKAP